MNTLEDAFINIGLEEDKFLGNLNLSQDSHSNHDNPKLQVPASINKSI